eukprot:jgi/Psemu1/33935/gm1.33935_g
MKLRIYIGRVVQKTFNDGHDPESVFYRAKYVDGDEEDTKRNRDALSKQNEVLPMKPKLTPLVDIPTHKAGTPNSEPHCPIPSFSMPAQLTTQYYTPSMA